MIGLLRWLPLSLALHSAGLAATLLLPRERALLPLFVDLTLSTPPDDTRAASTPTAGEAVAPPRSQRAASPARPTGQVSARSATAPPVASAPVPSPRASEPAAPAPAAADPPTGPSIAAPGASAPVETPAPAAPPESSPPVAAASAPEDGGSGTTASAQGGGAPPGAGPGGAGGAGRTESAGDAHASAAAARGGGGTGGETLALAIPGDDGAAYAGYISLLRRRVQEALTYPSAARRRGMSGTVHLDISVEPTGRIADVLVVRSSSHAILDAAALDAVRALREVPFPPGVRARPVRVRLPVVFELR